MVEKYTWIPFYKELATKLLKYKDNRNEYKIVKYQINLLQKFHSMPEKIRLTSIQKNSCFKFRNCVVPSTVKAEIVINSERCLDIVLRD